MLQRDAHGVAAKFWNSEVSHDRGRAQTVSLVGERGDQVSRIWPVGTDVRGDHPLLAIGGNHDRVGVELAVRVELLLGESERRVEQAVEIFCACWEALSRQEAMSVSWPVR